MNAQLKSKNAWIASQKAALNCFLAQLAADQALFDAQSIRRFLGEYVVKYSPAVCFARIGFLRFELVLHELVYTNWLFISICQIYVINVFFTSKNC